MQLKSCLPLQLENFGNQGSNKLAVDGASQTAEIVDQEHSDDGDELAKLEADMAIAKKAAWQKTAEAKAEKEAAAALAALEKTAALAATKAGKGKTAAAKAGGEAAAPTTKGKAGKGKAAASTGDGKAVVPKAKGKAKAAAGVGPPCVFDIAGWISTHIQRAEAKSEPKRRNYVSNAHKRSRSAAELCGIHAVKPITKLARDAAGCMHDSVHKKNSTRLNQPPR
jgi:hypothetical protein